MPSRTVSVPGKIILSGDHAVVSGFPGIAMPSRQRLTVTFEERDSGTLELRCDPSMTHPAWQNYLDRIVRESEKIADRKWFGTITIENDIPIGKGMGSSTAAVIAIARCLFGEGCENHAQQIEDAVNPGNSGLDFAVIWNNRPLRFQRGHEPKDIALPSSLEQEMILIDTGMPRETTPELVAWVQARKKELMPFFEIIGRCTERIEGGEPLASVIPDHHRAQVALGVVPQRVQRLIEGMEEMRGAAKVIGAGGRTGCSGVVLGLHKDSEALRFISERSGFSIVH
ncbi:hypothetical protein HY285_04845 [Candidatus Peregrinibacteria bacterium]|nr:hypothetical protein [Candidatus Peregrinibacteria bacterium]MBI3816838.1 hypothetical protein [Candidatus Peregrinibacteria bacterium]